MISLQEFKQLIGRKVRRFQVIVWSPYFETKMSHVGMWVGFEFDDDQGTLYQIHIDKNDGETPIVSKTEFNEIYDTGNNAIYDWSEFQYRVDSWMDGRLDTPILNEFFDVTHEELFRNISSKEILDVEFITVKGEFNPFAVKIVFRDDYIILSSIADGSTFETSMFNQLDNLEVFRHLGEFEFLPLKTAVGRSKGTPGSLT